MTPNAAKDALTAADIPKSGFKNIPKDQKVSRHSLKGFQNI